MNKSDFVSALATDLGVTLKQAAEFVDGYHNRVGKTLASGENITFVGFGTYEVRRRNAREARNPRTGETLTIKAKRAPAFKPGKALKDRVN